MLTDWEKKIICQGISNQKNHYKEVFKLQQNKGKPHSSPALRISFPSQKNITVFNSFYNHSL